jgi:membrane associated rhomboid family serine protease
MSFNFEVLNSENSSAVASSLDETSSGRGAMVDGPEELQREEAIDGTDQGVEEVDHIDGFPLRIVHLPDEEVDHIDGFPLRIVHLPDPDGPTIGEHAAESQPRSLGSSPESISTLVDTIRLCEVELAKMTDFDLKRRIKDFRFAQSQRRKRYSYRPYGIIGLFVNLSDTRADLHWAEDAAWRRTEHMPYVRWKDYEKARQHGMNRCYFTYAMLLVCTVMMLIAFHWNHWKIEPLSVNPLVGPKPEILLLLGALQMREMVKTGSWYRLVTAVFLHGGILHLVVNLVVLGLLGRAVERNHGLVDTAILFFISAIGGNIISCLMQPEYILVGSSGGIFGLIGICVADIVLNWKLLFLVFKNRDGRPAGYLVRFCSMFWLFSDLVMNSIIGFTPFVDNFAHLGGLAYGFLISLTVLQRLPLSFFGRGNGVFFKIRIGTLRVMGVVLAVALLVVTSILLSKSDGLKSPCYKCRYISCAPFPFWLEEKWWYCDGCDAVSGEVFRRGDDDAVYTDLHLFCPGSGELVEVDIAASGHTDASDVQDSLGEYCRELC